MNSESLSISAASGDTTAYVALRDDGSSKEGRAVLVIQEYWGLKDHIKDIANRWAAEGFLAIAPDLYRGRIANTADEAGQMMKELKVDDGIDIIRGTIAAATSELGVTHFGITGFCMGGTYALRSACLLEGLARQQPFTAMFQKRTFFTN